MPVQSDRSTRLRMVSPSITLPEGLLEQIERGNILIFVGDEIARDSDGHFVFERLTEQLAARCQTAITPDSTFPEIAQIYEAEAGRHALIQFIRDQLALINSLP